jgi:hypothetical protein
VYAVRCGGGIEQHFFSFCLNHVQHGTELAHALLGRIGCLA